MKLWPVRIPNDGVLAYFDMHVWVGLARARLRRDSDLHSTWNRLLSASAGGALQVALTDLNYLELLNRRDSRSRREVAATMAELTGYVTLRSADQMTSEEVTRALSAQVQGALPEPLERELVLSVGARHAFGSPTGRFRFVESVATGDTDEGERAEAPPELVALWDMLDPAVFEWMQLVGMDLGHDQPGIDVTPTYRLGDAWMSSQQRLRAWVGTESDPSLLYRAIANERLETMRYLCVAALGPNGPEVLVPDPLSGWLFIATVPIEYALVELLFAAHRDLHYAFRQHDRADVYDLARALPHCDVVVPDKHWAHIANASGLSDGFGTQVPVGRAAFTAWADRL